MIAVYPSVSGNPPLSWLRFRWYFQPNVWVLVMPHWFLVLVVATLSALPWFRWRFSLRTLLIVTTLIAVALGAIGYAVR